jgi:diaminohydroxyphosphoribosylaminopyrimidine deaminase/5-amino-6-(5-phosphoribosylamino)uracil reductase
LNESFARFIRTGKPLITLKSAMTLDGKIAAAPTLSKNGSVILSSETSRSGRRSDRPWITGESARAHVQQLRHQSDAIMVGVGTVIADDPLLTDRSGLPRRRALLRVILDSQLRIPLDSQLIKTASSDVLVLCSRPAEENRSALEALGVRVQQVSATPNGRPDFVAVVRTLAEMQITSLLIEGGSMVNSGVLASGEVDKIFLYYAPIILGGAAVPFLSEEGPGREIRHVQNLEVHRFGEDLAVEGYLRDPFETGQAAAKE